jgi:hypothetical protein
MAGSRAFLVAALIAVGALGISGCRGTAPQPVTRKEAPPAKAAPASAPESVPAAKAEPPRDDAAVVVDPGADDGKPTSLAEAAKAERDRRARAGQPVAVITDKTLPKYASKGQITVADPKEKDKKATAAQAAAAEQLVRDEQYWRGRGLDIRLRWRQAAEDVQELEQRSAELRQRFYGENDPLVRDNRIKPEWDRVLDRLRQARLEVDATRKELAQFLDEGRTAGAQPGWLREGEDQEPPEEPQKKEPPPPAQSIEPPVLEPPADDRPPGGWR